MAIIVCKLLKPLTGDTFVCACPVKYYGPKCELKYNPSNIKSLKTTQKQMNEFEKEGNGQVDEQDDVDGEDDCRGLAVEDWL